MDEAYLHLRVKREQKGEWVRLSRADGEKLSDWIIDKIERGISSDERKKNEPNS